MGQIVITSNERLSFIRDKLTSAGHKSLWVRGKRLLVCPTLDNAELTSISRKATHTALAKVQQNISEGYIATPPLFGGSNKNLEVSQIHKDQAKYYIRQQSTSLFEHLLTQLDIDDQQYTFAKSEISNRILESEVATPAEYRILQKEVIVRGQNETVEQLALQYVEKFETIMLIRAVIEGCKYKALNQIDSTVLSGKLNELCETYFKYTKQSIERHTDI